MLAKTPLRDLAIGWLEEQDSNYAYDWKCATGCACAKLAASLGRTEEWTTYHRSNWSKPTLVDWHDLNMIARGDGLEDWTYGKFLKRLKVAA